MQIFARAKQMKLNSYDDALVYFGNEEKTMYDINELDDGLLIRMAMKRNHIYALENLKKKRSKAGEVSELSKEEISNCFQNAEHKWYVEWEQSKRDSSIYAALSIRGKLLMMGLDVVKKSAGTNCLSWQEYMDWYAGTDLPAYENNTENGHGQSRRKGIEFQESRAKNMARQEHLRWNAYMISRGIVPAPIDAILHEKNAEGHFTNGTNYQMRRHGNLTTFDGLVQFRRLVAERDGCSEESADVINYDYQVMDDAWWILDEMGYGMIRIR